MLSGSNLLSSKKAPCKKVSLLLPCELAGDKSCFEKGEIQITFSAKGLADKEITIMLKNYVI